MAGRKGFFGTIRHWAARMAIVTLPLGVLLTQLRWTATVGSFLFVLGTLFFSIWMLIAIAPYAWAAVDYHDESGTFENGAIRAPSATNAIARMVRVYRRHRQGQ
jgi:hypothetical protein